MISWLLVAELMSCQCKKIPELVGERMATYPSRRIPPSRPPSWITLMDWAWIR